MFQGVPGWQAGFPHSKDGTLAGLSAAEATKDSDRAAGPGPAPRLPTDDPDEKDARIARLQHTIKELAEKLKGHHATEVRLKLGYVLIEAMLCKVHNSLSCMVRSTRMQLW